MSTTAKLSSEQTREILRKVRQIEIRTNRLVDEALAGEYHSVFKGRGMDFDEVREYVPGDDVRRIDWNVTARAGRPFIKKFTEERELTILLLVDVSASGDFGSKNQSKREMSAELASVLAFSAIRNNDKVGLILFTDKIEKYLPPKKGRSHVLRVVREILFFEPQGRGTDIAAALEFANRVTLRRSIAFLVSDFIVAQGQSWQDTQDTLRLTSKRHDLVALDISDPHEHTLPDIGIATLQDPESGEIFEVNTSDTSIRERFANLAKQRRMDVRKLFQMSGVEHLELNTAEIYLLPLMQFFRNRTRRRI